MPLFGFRRGQLHRRSVLRWLLIAVSLVVLFSSLEVLSIQSALAGASTNQPETPRQQRVFIASIHWNNEQILRHHWVPAVVALVKEFGPENVFVSVQESGSWDDSKGVLRLLDQELAKHGIPRRIVLSDTTHLDEISRPPGADGWIDTPRGKTELRRIPYLARLRNEVMQPLYEMQNASRRFDKILFLNDVVFQVSLPSWCLETWTWLNANRVQTSENCSPPTAEITQQPALWISRNHLHFTTPLHSGIPRVTRL
jgi:hypothetical protein